MSDLKKHKEGKEMVGIYSDSIVIVLSHLLRIHIVSRQAIACTYGAGVVNKSCYFMTPKPLCHFIYKDLFWGVELVGTMVSSKRELELLLNRLAYCTIYNHCRASFGTFE